MTQEATVAGWLVQVTLPSEPIDSGEVVGAAKAIPERFKFFNVAISLGAEAAEAVKMKMGANGTARIRLIRPLSEADLEAANLKPDDVKPA